MAIVCMNHKTGEVFVEYNGHNFFVSSLSVGFELARTFNREYIRKMCAKRADL